MACQLIIGAIILGINAMMGTKGITALVVTYMVFLEAPRKPEGYGVKK